MTARRRAESTSGRSTTSATRACSSSATWTTRSRVARTSSRTASTRPDTHCGYLEPQSTLADYNTGTGLLTVYTCNQLPHYLQQTIVAHLDHADGADPRRHSRRWAARSGARPRPTPSCLVACLLSRQLGRPVKITYTREEVFHQNKGRHPAHMKMKMGFDERGPHHGARLRLPARRRRPQQLGLRGDVVHRRADAPALQAARTCATAASRVYTNKPTPGRAALPGRRPGPHGVREHARHGRGEGSASTRTRSACATPSRPATRGRRSSRCGTREFKKCLETVAARSGFVEKYGKLPYGRGIGMAGGHYSTGGAFLLYPSYRPHSTAQLRVDTEAGITLYIGATAIGQGATTVLAQMVAEELGVDYREVHLVCQDTMLAPMDNGTYDSRLTYGAGHAIKNAAADVKAQALRGRRDDGRRAGKEHLECVNGEIRSIHEPSRKVPFKKAVYQYSSSVGPLFGDGQYTPPQPKGDYDGKLIGPSPAFGFSAQVGRGRGRPRDRADQGRRLLGGRRLRQGHQPDVASKGRSRARSRWASAPAFFEEMVSGREGEDAQPQLPRLQDADGARHAGPAERASSTATTRRRPTATRKWARARSGPSSRPS